MPRRGHPPASGTPTPREWDQRPQPRSVNRQRGQDATRPWAVATGPWAFSRRSPARGGPTRHIVTSVGWTDASVRPGLPRSAGRSSMRSPAPMSRSGAHLLPERVVQRHAARAPTVTRRGAGVGVVYSHDRSPGDLAAVRRPEPVAGDAVPGDQPRDPEDARWRDARSALLPRSPNRPAAPATGSPETWGAGTLSGSGTLSNGGSGTGGPACASRPGSHQERREQRNAQSDQRTKTRDMASPSLSPSCAPRTRHARRLRLVTRACCHLRDSTAR